MAKKQKSDNSKNLHPVHAPGIDFLKKYNGDDEAKKKMLNLILEDFNASKDWRAPYRQQWIENYQLYRNYDPKYDGLPDHFSKIFVPKCHEMVSTILPRLMGAIFDSAPVFCCLPTEKKNEDESRAVEWLLQSRVENNEFYLQHYQAFVEMLCYGSGWIKMLYEVKDDYEGPVSYSKDIFDVYPDPMCDSVESARFIIDREVKHIDDLKELEKQGIYKNLAEVEKNKDGSDNYISQLDRQRFTNTYGSPTAPTFKNTHEVLEYWGRFTDNDGETYDIICAIADRNVIIRWEENPYVMTDRGADYPYAIKPFILFRMEINPHELYGSGVIDQIKSLQYEMNDRRNQYTDGLKMAASPVYQVVTGGVENLDDLAMGPGEVVEVLMMNAITPIQKDTSFLMAVQDLQMLEQNIRDAIGVHETMSGTEGTTRKTATEIISSLQEANQRIKQILSIMECTSLKDEAKMMLAMDRQFTDGVVLARMTENKEFIGCMEIEPKKLQWDGKFKLQVASLYGSKQIAVQQLFQFLEVTSQAIPDITERIDYGKMLKMIADALEIKTGGLFKEPEKAKPVEPQTPPPGNIPPMPPELQPNPLAGTGQLGMAPQIALQGAPMPPSAMPVAAQQLQAGSM